MKISSINNYYPNFQSTREHIVNSAGKAINCHYTNMNRTDLDWNKFAKFLADRFNREKEIKINLFGCSDGSEVYTLMLAIKKLPQEIANKFKIFASDISEKMIKTAKNGEILLHDKDLNFLEQNNGMEYFLLDSDKEVKEMRGIKFYPYSVRDDLTKSISYSVKDVREAVRSEDYSSQVFMFRNGWTYNTLDEQDKIAKNLRKNSDEKTLVVIGQSDLFKSDANRALQDNGFKGIESEIFNPSETDYPSETIGKPLVKSNYPDFLLFEKKN